MDTQHYAALLELERPVSRVYSPMPRQQRAAQFAPFAAVVGHEDAIAEEARLTQRRVELDEGERERLDRRWRCIRERAAESPTVTITYFCADSKKDGGACLTVSGYVEYVNDQQRWMRMSAGTVIPFADVLSIDSDWLDTDV